MADDLSQQKSGSTRGDDDYWGVKDIENCCGRMNVKIPSDIAPGDYFLRAEVIALHAAYGGGGAQLYMSCYQLTVSGGGSATPATVKFPGAYSQSDSGLGSIHGNLNSFVVPGPAVYSGGSTQVPGSGTCPVLGGTAPNPTTTRGGAQTTLATTTRGGQQTTAQQTTTAAPSTGGSPLYGRKLIILVSH